MMSAVLDVYYTVRLMDEGDLDQVMVIEEASYDFCWTRKIFSDCLKAGYCGLVLVDEEFIKGYSVLLLGPKEAHVLNVCIADSERGQGWARHMMREMIDMSIRAKCEEIFLEVRPSNPVAMGLYHSLGFNEIGIRPNYYKAKDGREDAIVMAMSLHGMEPSR